MTLQVRTDQAQAYIDFALAVLKDKIEHLKNINKKPILIAVSRKMPRFIKFLVKHYIKDEVEKRYWKVVFSEITTEHAIPFLFEYHAAYEVSFAFDTNQESNVILLDDISLSGNTIETIAEQIRQLTGIYPHIVIFFLCDESWIWINEEFPLLGRDGIKLIKFNTVRDWVNFINEAIKLATLPIDLEFPIIYLNRSNALYRKMAYDPKEKFKRTLIEESDKLSDDGITSNLIYNVDHVLDWDNSKIEKRTTSIVVFDEYIWGYNSEFAKVRVFYDSQDCEVRIAGFCPNNLSVFDVADNNLFKEPRYSYIWETLHDKLRDMGWKIEDAWQTLVVSANYLYSLAFIIRNKQRLLLEDLNDARVCLSDFCLLYGTNLAEEVKKIVDIIIREELVVLPLRGRFVSLPDRIVESNIESAYDYLSAVNLFNENEFSIEDLLRAKFGFTDFEDGEFYKFEDFFVTPESGIFETVTSLKEYISSYRIVNDLEKNIHQWLDGQIDEGYIVPRYKTVSGTDGIDYVKRFFTLSNSVTQI